METHWVPTGTTSDATAASTMEGFTQIVGPTIKVYDIRSEHELCVRECVCVYIYMHVNVCMYACMHVCMDAGMDVCMDGWMYACIHACMYACMLVCM